MNPHEDGDERELGVGGGDDVPAVAHLSCPAVFIIFHCLLSVLVMAAGRADWCR